MNTIAINTNTINDQEVQKLGRIELNANGTKFVDVEAWVNAGGNWTVVCVDNNDIEWNAVKKDGDRSELGGDYNVVKVNKHRNYTPQYKKVNKKRVVISLDNIEK